MIGTLRLSQHRCPKSYHEYYTLPKSVAVLSPTLYISQTCAAIRPCPWDFLAEHWVIFLLQLEWKERKLLSLNRTQTMTALRLLTMDFQARELEWRCHCPFYNIMRERPLTLGFLNNLEHYGPKSLGLWGSMSNLGLAIRFWFTEQAVFRAGGSIEREVQVPDEWRHGQDKMSIRSKPRQNKILPIQYELFVWPSN